MERNTLCKPHGTIFDEIMINHYKNYINFSVVLFSKLTLFQLQLYNVSIIEQYMLYSKLQCSAYTNLISSSEKGIIKILFGRFFFKLKKTLLASALINSICHCQRCLVLCIITTFMPENQGQCVHLWDVFHGGCPYRCMNAVGQVKVGEFEILHAFFNKTNRVHTPIRTVTIQIISYIYT